LKASEAFCREQRDKKQIGFFGRWRLLDVPYFKSFKGSPQTIGEILV
jgi:hypothetical protein